jgi:hypothetical protein
VSSCVTNCHLAFYYGQELLYPSSYIIKVIKSRRIRWARHVARMVEIRIMYFFFLENLNRKDHLGDLCEDGRIILKLNLNIV